MKISMLPSVHVIYLIIDHKFISTLIINKRRERVYWGESGKSSKIIIIKKTARRPCPGVSDQSCTALYMNWV